MGPVFDNRATEKRKNPENTLLNEAGRTESGAAAPQPHKSHKVKGEVTMDENENVNQMFNVVNHYE